MASGDEVALISAVVALTLLLVLIVGIFVVISSLDDSPAVGAGGAGGTAAGATAAGPAGGLAGAWTAKKRVYTSGVRLEELFRWTSLEASEALAAYASQMEGDEREAFYARLPQITNLVLGLDHSGPDKPVGWLNEQYKLLVEPNKDARAAAQLQSRLQDVLEAPPPSSASSPLHHKRPSSSSSSSVFGIGGRPAERQRYGIVFEELVADAGRAPEAGMDYKYTFFCKYLPVPAQKALAEGQQQLVPQLFLQCLAQGMAGGAVAARPPRGGTEEPQGLVLSAWVYFLFCFCLWPASDHGQNALDGSVTPASSGLPGMLGGRSQSEPLYVVLLNSYLKYFIHLEKPCWPESGGSLLLQAIAQFWLCQNAAPSVAEKLSPQPFQDTKASILLCLEHVVRHVNAHVAEHLAQYEPHYAGGLSAHGALQPAMYHYFEKQLASLPDVSARVIVLMRVTVLYLHPWRPAADKSANSASSTAAAAAAAAVADGASSGLAQGILADGAPAWAWADFVRHNYLFYARLLTSFAREVRTGRFSFHERQEKRDLQMMREVAALFDSPHVLPLMRELGEALEQLLNPNQPTAVASPLRAALEEQLNRLEGEPTRWRDACQNYMPSEMYKELDKLDKHLQTKMDELRKEHKSFFEGTALQQGSSPMQTLDALRNTTQRALRTLQPAGHDVASVRTTDGRTRRSSISLRTGSEAPLSADEKLKLASGRVRCSALKVAYRVTPALPVRPISSWSFLYGEIRVLVELTEGVATWLSAYPQIEPLLQWGLHPRFLASTFFWSLLLSVGLVHAFPHLLSIAFDWLVGGAPMPSWLFVLWSWVVLFLSLTAGMLGLLHFRQWQMRHRPSQVGAAETWVPWLAQQLQHGIGEEELRSYLERALSSASTLASSRGPVQIDSLLARARERAQLQ